MLTPHPPVQIGGRRPKTIEVDEHPKPDTTLETLAKLRPAFEEGGSVTAGNASGINDSAAALVLATQSAAREKGLTGLVTLEAVAAAAMDPALMGYAPVLALQSLFEQAGTTLVTRGRVPNSSWRYSATLFEVPG